jgi:hypothetical protein
MPRTSTLTVHPVANVFPLMEGDEFEAFKADIAAHGQREPVWLHEGRIIDGRNRYRACQVLGIEVQTREWDGKGSLVAFVVSLNMHRRHLTAGQRATLGVEVDLLMAKEAKERQRAGGKAAGRGRPKQVEATVPQPNCRAPQARDQAAKATRSSARNVSEAKRLKAQALDLFEKVRAGAMTLPQAKREVRQREVSKAKRAAEDRAAAGYEATADRWRVDGPVDCLEWFASQPADWVDLVFGSPPYERARLYLENGTNLGISRDTRQWVQWMVNVTKAALRVCNGLVAFVVEGQTNDYCWSAAPVRLMTALADEGICIRKPPIYQRVGIPGSGGPDWLRNDYEFIVCATRGGKLPWSENTAMGEPPRYPPGGQPSHRTTDGRRVNQATRGHSNGDTVTGGYTPPDVANPGNVIRCLAGGGNMGDDLCHENEAPFPESLVEFFVRSFCPPGGVVCDPFVGSGTTAVVARRHGRRFVGCDLRASQVELSRQRIAEA